MLVLIVVGKDTIDIQTIEGLHATVYTSLASLSLASLTNAYISTKIPVEGEDDEL